MDFRTISDTGKKVRLEWDSIADHGKQMTTYESKERPVEEFTAALRAFAKPVRSALGLPDEHEFEVRGVTIEYVKKGDNEGDLAGAVVHVLLPVEGTNRVCNAHPFIAIAEYELVAGLIATIEEVAEDYFGGTRAQIEFGDESDEDEGDDEDGLTEEQRERAGADWSGSEEQPELQPA